MDVQYFEAPARLRAWFSRNHARDRELWVGFHKVGSGVKSVTYAEALDEALCVGWIDGVRKRVGEDRYAIRFTPRRPGSNWSRVNVAKAKALIEGDWMKPAGLAAFEARDTSRASSYSYENRPTRLDAASEAALRKDKKAWVFWSKQPPSYVKAAAGYVASAKREEMRARRLAALVECSRQGERLPQLEGKARKRPGNHP